METFWSQVDMRITHFLLLIGAAGGLMACSETAGPELGEMYVLRSIDDDPLPAVYRDGDFATLHILADTLFLANDGTGQEVRLSEMVDKADGSANRYTSVTEFDYEIANGQIEIAYECADMGSCIAPPHLAGAVTITGIAVDVSLGRVPLLFERVDQGGL